MSARNLVDLLERHDAGGLQKLRATFPAAGDLLSWDRVLGPNAIAPGDDVAVRAALAATAAGAVRQRADTIIANLSARLRRAQRLKTCGAAVAAILNAGLIAALSKAVDLGGPSAELLLASGALLASLLAIFAERAAGGAAGTGIADLFDRAVTLSSAALEADLRRQRLDARATITDWDSVLAALDVVALGLHTIDLKARVA